MKNGALQHEWLRTARTLLLDAYWPPFNPRLEFDAVEAVRALRAVGGNTIRFGAMGKYALIPNPAMPIHPALNGRDILAELLEALNPESERVVAYIPVSHGLPGSLLDGPCASWALRLDDGGRPAGVQHFGGELVAPVCPFGPYRERSLEFVHRIVSHYPIAGIYLDGPYYNWNMSGPLAICQCPDCRRLFQQETGEALFSNAALANAHPQQRAQWLPLFHRWVGRGLLKLLREIVALADTKKLPVLMNAFACGARPPSIERAMIRSVAGVLLEGELTSLTGLGVGQYEDKVIWRYTQPHTPWPRLSTRKQEEANALVACETIMHGGAPIVSYGGRFMYGATAAEPLRRMFDFLRDHQTILSGLRPVKYAGLISTMSVTKGAACNRRALTGAWQALQHSGMQTSIVPRAALRNRLYLQDFAALVLPGDALLSRAEADALAAFVDKGGALIGMAPETPDAGNDLLAGLFGLLPDKADPILQRRRGALRFWNGAWEVYAVPRSALMEKSTLETSPSGWLPLRAVHWFDAAPDTRVLADVLGGDDAESPLGPCVIERVVGKGRAIYVGFPLGALYEEIAEAGLASLLGALVAHGARRAPPFRWGRPASVQSLMHEKPGLRVLHLLPQGARQAVSLQLPCEGSGQPEIHCLNTGAPVPSRRTEDGPVICDLELDGYTCLVIR
jgi:hypothetical protein